MKWGGNLNGNKRFKKKHSKEKICSKNIVKSEIEKRGNFTDQQQLR